MGKKTPETQSPFASYNSLRQHTLTYPCKRKGQKVWGMVGGGPPIFEGDRNNIKKPEGI